MEAVRRGKERVGSDQQFIGGTAGETVDRSFSAKFGFRTAEFGRQDKLKRTLEIWATGSQQPCTALVVTVLTKRNYLADVICWGAVTSG